MISNEVLWLEQGEEMAVTIPPGLFFLFLSSASWQQVEPSGGRSGESLDGSFTLAPRGARRKARRAAGPFRGRLRRTYGNKMMKGEWKRNHEMYSHCLLTNQHGTRWEHTGSTSLTWADLRPDGPEAPFLEGEWLSVYWDEPVCKLSLSKMWLLTPWLIQTAPGWIWGDRITSIPWRQRGIISCLNSAHGSQHSLFNINIFYDTKSMINKIIGLKKFLQYPIPLRMIKGFLSPRSTWILCTQNSSMTQ